MRHKGGIPEHADRNRMLELMSRCLLNEDEAF
jgi:hypothetical protein